MTSEEQRIAIAEACGYTNVHRDRLGFLVADLKVDHFGIPDYLNDLNAMHEAEKILTPEQRRKYRDHLLLFYTGSAWYHSADLLSATASQRAEAFLRTIGKWNEE